MIAPLVFQHRHLNILTPRASLSGSHRSTRIASDSASHAVASQARPQRVQIAGVSQSHRRPDRSESPNRRHFASLCQETCDFLASHANIASFSHERSGQNDYHSCVLRGFRIAGEKYILHRWLFGGVRFESHRTSQLHRAIRPLRRIAFFGFCCHFCVRHSGFLCETRRVMSPLPKGPRHTKNGTHREFTICECTTRSDSLLKM